MTQPNDKVYDGLLPEAALEFAHTVTESVKHSDIVYVCDNIYPFLQIASPVHNLLNAELNIVTAKNGWKIIDYGEVLSVAAPHDKNGDAGNGTIVKQQFDVALEMMELVKQRYWGKIGDGKGDEGGESGKGGEGELKPAAAQILGGTPMMQRFAWFAAQVLGINLEGFAPTAEDQKWLETLYDKYVAKGKAEVMEEKIMNN